MAKPRNHTQNGNRGQGSNWIRRDKRLRIYARDGWKCCWCGCEVADARTLAGNPLSNARVASLDHFLNRSRGGTNAASNLLTCCLQCNDKRGEKSALQFATDLATAYGASDSDSKVVRVARAFILERCIRSLEAPLLTLEERSAA